MNDPFDRHTTYAEMLAMTQRLVAEYAGRIPAGRVIACVALSREHLLRTGVRQGIVAATEASAHLRLSARLPSHSVA